MCDHWVQSPNWTRPLEETSPRSLVQKYQHLHHLRWNHRKSDICVKYKQQNDQRRARIGDCCRGGSNDGGIAMNALGFDLEKKKVPFSAWRSDEHQLLWTTGIIIESFCEIWPEVRKRCNWTLSSLNKAVCSMTIGTTRVWEGAMVNLSRRRRLIPLRCYQI